VSVLQIDEHRAKERVRIDSVQSDLVLSGLRAAVRRVQGDLIRRAEKESRPEPKVKDLLFSSGEKQILRFIQDHNHLVVNNAVESVWSVVVAAGYSLRKNFWIDSLGTHPHFAPAFNTTV